MVTKILSVMNGCVVLCISFRWLNNSFFFFTQSQILEPHIQPLPSSVTMIQHVDCIDAVPGLDDRLWEHQQVSEKVEVLEFIYDINLVLK